MNIKITKKKKKIKYKITQICLYIYLNFSLLNIIEIFFSSLRELNRREITEIKSLRFIGKNDETKV